MKCLICKGDYAPLMTKDFSKSHYGFLMRDTPLVHYIKCAVCGFTLSETHAAMDAARWSELNVEFHDYIESGRSPINQPPYIDQAVMLRILSAHGVITFDSVVDYAGGHGTLSRILRKYFDMRLPVFEPYMQASDGVDYIAERDLQTYDVVINSALFEHLFTRDAFDKINGLVSSRGCMIVHTVVCESVPRDENWFYMDPPVHCAFHTNKSMQLLMDQWQYEASIYCPPARCWVLLKKASPDLESVIAGVNNELQKEYLLFKRGFVDYWK